MSEEKIHSFYTLLFYNNLFQASSVSSSDFMLKSNLEIKSLLEESPYRNEEVLEILYYLSTDLKDVFAQKILSFKLKELYESGDIKLIHKYHKEAFFHELSFEDLLFLLFESESPLTHNFISSLKRSSISVSSLKKFILKLSIEDRKVTSYLLADCFLLLGSEDRDDHKFRDAMSQWQIWELFNSYKRVLQDI